MLICLQTLHTFLDVEEPCSRIVVIDNLSELIDAELVALSRQTFARAKPSLDMVTIEGSRVVAWAMALKWQTTILLLASKDGVVQAELPHERKNFLSQLYFRGLLIVVRPNVTVPQGLVIIEEVTDDSFHRLSLLLIFLIGIEIVSPT